MQILSKILRFSQQQQIQKLQLFKYYTEKDNKKNEQNCHHQDRNLPLNGIFIAFKLSIISMRERIVELNIDDVMYMRQSVITHVVIRLFMT